MRKILIGIILLCGLFTTPAQAATTLEILPTHRQDRFTWHKAGIDGFPNILSELKWENLRIYAVKGILRHDTGRKTFLEATAVSAGFIPAPIRTPTMTRTTGRTSSPAPTRTPATAGCWTARWPSAGSCRRTPNSRPRCWAAMPSTRRVRRCGICIW